ncbi:MAG: glycosyltransferase family 2 protein [Clostridiaceae bacterium]|nr:glycosyltransferase family 2 protein [Clostridiaceae bacterium]
MISIIIPVYNINSKLINRCIDSILNQSYSDFEILIVDDGSDKSYIKHIDELSRKDTRIKVYRQKNSGVSTARNFGLRKAKGSYICFIDGDDTVEKDYLKEAFELCEDNNLDAVIGAERYVFESKVEEYRANLKKNQDVLIIEHDNINYFLAQLLSDSNIAYYPQLSGCRNGGPCWRLFKRKLINEITFNEKIIIFEDKVFNCEVLSKAHKIGVSNKIWYNYFQYSNSSINKFQPNMVKSFNELIKSTSNIVKDWPLELKPHISKFIIMSCGQLLNKCLYNEKSTYNYIERRRLLDECFNNKYWEKLINNFKYDFLTSKEKVTAYLILNKKYKRLFLFTKFTQALGKLKCLLKGNKKIEV